MLNPYGKVRGVAADGAVVVELRRGEDEPTRLRDDGIRYSYPPPTDLELSWWEKLKHWFAD